MIVLEGCDCAGKSTLAQRLFELIPSEFNVAPVVQHFTKLPTCFDRYWGYKQHVRSDVILDRFHMSHVVYRSMDQEENTLTPLKYELIDAAISNVGGIVVVIAPPPDVVIERFKKNEKAEMYNLNQVLRVNELYHMIATTRGILETPFGRYRMKVDVVTNGSISVDDLALLVMNAWHKRRLEMQQIVNDRLKWEIAL